MVFTWQRNFDSKLCSYINKDVCHCGKNITEIWCFWPYCQSIKLILQSCVYHVMVRCSRKQEKQAGNLVESWMERNWKEMWSFYFSYISVWFGSYWFSVAWQKLLVLHPGSFSSSLLLPHLVLEVVGCIACHSLSFNCRRIWIVKKNGTILWN